MKLPGLIPPKRVVGDLFAYVLGPNYNAGMEEDTLERAYDAAAKAAALSGNTSDKEKHSSMHCLPVMPDHHRLIVNH